MATMLSGITPTTDVVTAAAARRAVGSERAFGATDLAGNTFTGPPSSLFLPIEGTATGGLAPETLQSSTLAFAQTRADAADLNTSLDAAGTTTAAADEPPPLGSAAAQAQEAEQAEDLGYFDPLDANRDGTVSEMERFMASLEDPATAANDAAAFATPNPATAQASALYTQLAGQPRGREEPGRSLDVTA